MSNLGDETFLSYAVVRADGVVVRESAWAINSKLAPGPRRIETPQDAADYLATWAPTGPDQTVHVWIGGGIDVPVGGTLAGLRAADAVAKSTK